MTVQFNWIVNFLYMTMLDVEKSVPILVVRSLVRLVYVHERVLLVMDRLYCYVSIARYLKKSPRLLWLLPPHVLIIEASLIWHDGRTRRKSVICGRPSNLQVPAQLLRKTVFLVSFILIHKCHWSARAKLQGIEVGCRRKLRAIVDRKSVNITILNCGKLWMCRGSLWTRQW